MTIEQIYTGCLAQGAYYIQSEGEAAIIDPLREVAPYIERAQKDGVKIKYIFETHFHADFVSGHLTLAEKTGAQIIYGPLAQPQFAAHIATDGESFSLGNISIEALHTPGHTMESTTYLLRNQQGEPQAIFTGDTLFLGDVGRPDLAQKAAQMTKEALAEILYDSLRNKIMPLPDEVVVYPGHGAGSACGKNMMKETVDTLGHQKKVNYALRADLTKAAFVKEVTEGLLPPPGYFPLNVKMNKEGYQSIDQVLSEGTKARTPEALEAMANEMGALILDVRSPEAYAEAHIPGSMFIGLDGSFAPWVGELIIDVQQKLLLVVPEGREAEAVTRLSRVGFDHTLGFLEGGMAAWIAAGKETDQVETVTAQALETAFWENSPVVFDVRKTAEYTAQHLLGAQSTPLARINEHLDKFPRTTPFFVHCAGGYRSTIAASILKARGWHNLINVAGGLGAIKETTLPLSAPICPSTTS
ncbi:MAG: MBL fold metallo-hydrolase [Bacteroidota bacterium]